MGGVPVVRHKIIHPKLGDISVHLVDRPRPERLLRARERLTAAIGLLLLLLQPTPPVPHINRYSAFHLALSQIAPIPHRTA
jgi:hypothetical protein